MIDLNDQWPIEPLSEAAKTRLIRRAMASTQLLPWPQAVLAAVERGLSEWRYGMPYKVAAAITCVVLGLGIGLSVEPRDHDITGLAFMTATTSSMEMGE
jgi:hypothetical protein